MSDNLKILVENQVEKSEYFHVDTTRISDMADTKVIMVFG